MNSDNGRSAFCESGDDKERCYPYSILSKQQQLQQQHQRHYSAPHQPPVGQGFQSYQSSISPQMSHSSLHPPSAQGASFYGNTMVTDVGICFSMSNVDLNSDYPPQLGHPSLSVLGKGYGDAVRAPVNNVPPPLPKYRPTSSAYRARNLTPPNGMSMPSSHSSPSTSPYSIPYSPYYFAYPKIPVKIYNNRAVPYVPLPTNGGSTASAAAAYGQQLNSYFTYRAPPPPTESKLPSKFRRNASKNLMDNQYYDICMAECNNAMKTMLDSPPQRYQMSSPLHPAESPIQVDVDDSFVSDETDQADDECDFSDLPPLPDDDDDDDDDNDEENSNEEPQDFSMKPRTTIEEPVRVKDSNECSRRTTAAPKKKWIRQHMKDEPLVNGHSTAPPLVVISTNGSSSNSIISSSNIHQKHHAVSSLTIDLSTKSNIIGGSHRLSSTPPSSGCSSSSSTLTISPVDDSQSSLNLSGGSTSGYITSHSANSSSSLNLSGSSPLPINGSVIATSHGSNSSPLPHDLVIVQQQQQQQQQQISHLVQQAGQPHHGLTSTATLLSHIPTGGRRRTTSSNSNGVGTREVHNKLEKNRRAHLKECFEQLKKQLTLQPDEKKTSNLSILHAAIRHIQVLKRKEREYEHEMERLAKEKIASQNRILLLKRELSQWGDVDFSRLAPDTDAIPNSSGNITSTTTNVSSNGVQSDRDLLNDPPGRNGIRYSSSSSLSSVATTASIGNLPLQTTISPVLIAASSPTRASPPSLSLNRNSSSPMPLSLTTKNSPTVSETHNSTPSPLKFTTGITSLPNGFNLSTQNGLINGGSAPSGAGSNCSTPNSINGCLNGTPLPLIVNANNIGTLSQSQLFTPVTATILTTGNGTTLQTLPLNLNVTSSISNGHHTSSIVSTSNGMTSTASGLQIIGTTANGTAIPAGLISSATGKELINGTTLPRNGFRSDSNKIEIIATQSAAGSALEPPATKVIKLVNGNTIVGLTSVDKDKMMLSQVVQQGGLVMSPIQLLTPQGLRVIQQAPNGLATIELSTSANVQPQSNQTQRTIGGNSITSTNLSHLTSSQSCNRLPQQTHIQPMTGAQLHKILISSTNSSTSNGITTISTSGTTTGYSNGSTPIMTTTITPELARLPGGAELNILPAGTNGATALPLYRTTGHGGKLTFVNAISTGHGTGLTLKGADSSTSGTGRTAVHVVTPIQTSTGQLSGLTPVVVSRYDQDTGHMIGPFTTSTASAQQTTQLGKVVKTVGQSPGGLPLIAAAPNAQYFNAVFSSNRSNGNGGGAMLPLPPLTDGSGNMSGSGTPSLVLVNNSKTHSNHTPSPTVMIGSNGDVTAAVAI